MMLRYVRGSNFKAAAPANTTPLPAPEPLCTSEICTVKAPHLAKPFTKTTTDLPSIITIIESKKHQTRFDRQILDIFYTIHWDEVDKPLPAPTRECVNKECPVFARHEAKVFSMNPKKVDQLPVKRQQVIAKEKKTWDDVRGLKCFWAIHGPKDQVNSISWK